jgi:hypothetical protein
LGKTLGCWRRELPSLDKGVGSGNSPLAVLQLSRN